VPYSHSSGQRQHDDEQAFEQIDDFHDRQTGVIK
jgi:hypothetical protein